MTAIITQAATPSEIVERVRDDVALTPKSLHSINVESDEIVSGAAANGQVLTADGAGGTAWRSNSPFYLGSNAGQTLTLGTLFLAAAGRAHALGDWCCYLDTVAGAYRLCMAIGSGASEFIEFAAVEP